MTAALAAMAGQFPVATVLVQLSDDFVYAADIGPAEASYSIENTGIVSDSQGGASPWLLNGTPSNYEVRATLTGGTLSQGSTGSWLSCGTTTTWALINSRQNNSTIMAVMTIEIRDAATRTVRASATVTLEAESDNFN